jgi:Suppressor of fused protein (SUFU)
VTTHREIIEGHYGRLWGAPEGRLAWGTGPVRDLAPGFGVLRFRRGIGISVFATCGMSEPADEEGLEVHLLIRDRDADCAADSVIELLTVVAHFHRTGQRLGMGHTVNFGRPWLPSATCTHGLLSLPYLDGPRLEWLEKPRVRFLWLIPLTVDEVAFKKTSGLDALEERLEASRFDYLDPQRTSVC